MNTIMTRDTTWVPLPRRKELEAREMAALLSCSRVVARTVARPSSVLLTRAHNPRPRTIHTVPSGTWPVMLTPFKTDRSIDWETLGGSCIKP